MFSRTRTNPASGDRKAALRQRWLRCDQHLEQAEAETCWRWNLVIILILQRGRFVVWRVRHLIGGTRHILGVYWLWEEHLFWIQTTGTEWILWTRTLQTTMQHVSGEFLKLIFLLSSLIPIKNSCILQGTGNCQSQRHYCRLRSNLPFAQCGRDSQEPQVSQFLSHSKPTSLTDFTQSKVLTQLLPGLARVQIRWEAACQEGWAEAGEDQCKKKVTPVFFKTCGAFLHE